MKKINYKKSLGVLMLLMFQGVIAFANKGDNPPPPQGSDGFDDAWTVGGPIDNHLILLFFVAIIFGAIMISRMKLKASTT